MESTGLRMKSWTKAKFHSPFGVPICVCARPNFVADPLIVFVILSTDILINVLTTK